LSWFRLEILRLLVSSNARRGGIARRLIAEVARWATASVSRQFWCEVYPALGYKKIKTQAVYEKDVSAELEARSQHLTDLGGAIF
jgi:GNAT superfamily N-acetyltransferase